MQPDARPSAERRPPTDPAAPAGRIAPAVRAAGTLKEAAEAVTAHLVSAGLPMPSVYIERAGRLRCLAVRGYWQVLDGIDIEAGILGQTFRTGVEHLIQEADACEDFLVAIPGVQAELCVPLRHGARVVGALNVEANARLTDEHVALIRGCARLLEAKLDTLGGTPPSSPWQHLAQRSAELNALEDPSAVAALTATTACELSGLDSAVVVLPQDSTELTVAAACGPLGTTLTALPPGIWAHVLEWVQGSLSVYTYGAPSDSHILGSEELHAAGIQATAIAPIETGTGPGGFVLVVDDRPHRPERDDIERLELLAAHAGQALRGAYALVELRRQAATDSLTGLGHTATFHAKLAAWGQRADDHRLAVLLIDLDGFKGINDEGGHAAGDALLKEVAAALRDALRGSDRVFRVGGDEFSAIVSVRDEAEALRVGERVCAAIRRTRRVTASVGVALTCPDDDRDEPALLADADLALYEAKRQGRDRVVVYDPKMRAEVLRRAQLAAELSTAIPAGQLFLVYQPVVDLPSGALLGLEALVRWQHPTRGVVGPGEFIPVAEEDGQIIELGQWVLAEVCRQSAAWTSLRPEGALRLKIAWNVSGRELSPEYVSAFEAAVAASGCDPDQLVLEVTERVLVDDEGTLEVLADLRRRGVKIAIDDFGTGYSSLSYLRRLPIDILKIDRSFVAELDDPRNAAVARAIIDLARTLQLSSVAEGVEELVQVEQLRALGCDHAQGWFYARPLPPDELDDVVGGATPWLESGTGLSPVAATTA